MLNIKTVKLTDVNNLAEVKFPFRMPDADSSMCDLANIFKMKRYKFETWHNLDISIKIFTFPKRRSNKNFKMCVYTSGINVTE